MKKILITGGAGFIGSNLAIKLAQRGYQIIILDNLSPQIHGEGAEFPLALHEVAECILGDVSSPESYHKLPQDIDAVFHLAAETGTGQSMYAISKYSQVNVMGTAYLMEYLAKNTSVSKIILSSTRAVYGEGSYRCTEHGIVNPGERFEQDLLAGLFEPRCPICKSALHLLPTSEDSALKPLSVYGISKLAQELLLLNTAKSLNIPTVALRFQNVYGPGQSLSNPYTGILSIFSTRIRHGQDIFIFEDGNESRDFVYIDDVINSLILSLENDNANNHVFNIGSGIGTSVQDVSNKLVEKLSASVKLHITGKFRVGDIRHNVADISKATNILNYSPRVHLDEGLTQFVEWVKRQPLPTDKSDSALVELKERGLFK